MSNSLDSKLLFSLLSAKGVKFLHHANTVKTSLTFIKAKSLLSRAYVEKNSLDQTEQYTDTKDKKFDIWDSVFFGWLGSAYTFWS